MFEDSLQSSLLFSPLSAKHSEHVIPIFFSEDMEEDSEQQNQEKDIPSLLPIVKNLDLIVFPKIVVPVLLKDPQSLKIMERAYELQENVGIISRKKNTEKFFSYGTTVSVMKILELPDGKKSAIVRGNMRFLVEEIIQKEAYMFAKIKPLQDKNLTKETPKIAALIKSIREASKSMFSHVKEGANEIKNAIDKIKNSNFLINFLCFNLHTDPSDKQRLLTIDDVEKRGKFLLKHLLKSLELIQLQKKIQSKLFNNIQEHQKNFYLKQQIKVLQNELGDDEEETEIDELRLLGEKKKWPQAVADFFSKNLDKAERLHTHSADYASFINHAELFLELPWQEYTKDNFDLVRAKKILDKNHYGLEKVKERIIEYLAVLKLKNNMKGPILCLYGPPGVGKTSLGESIAKALNRKYVKIALGGIQDEAEIRGHRKTYVASMPGRILQNISKAKSSNPVMLLDEIDKVNHQFRGDPSSALLEVLDPEQNNTFTDHFLEMPYDLSQVLFIATANTLDTISKPLLDRMEVIDVNGYTIEEKILIAQKYLLPKQKKNHGLKAKDVTLTLAAIQKIIEEYTRESGVRELNRKIGATVRKTAKNIVLNESYVKKIHVENITQLLGHATFDKEIYQNITAPGVAIGLAWTPVGGDILFIEASLSKGKGKLTLSGQLGDVMKESAITALSYIKAYASDYAIDHRIFQQYDLHIHVPAGAIPKDGPSAGITLFSAILSLYTQRKVKGKLAMTGEITLRGKILPVGGIQEKILAAKHAGIDTIILSEKNQKDIDEIKKEYIQNMHIFYIDTIDELVPLVLEKDPVKDHLIWDYYHEKASSCV